MLIDLSHAITEGMVTYKGLPGPHICDFLSREASAAHYDGGETFQIGRIDMVSNTGTYLDVPFHRFEDGDDLAAIDLARVAELEGVRVRSHCMAAGPELFEGLDAEGKAVLIETGWSRHWGSAAYYDDHPFLSAAAAELLVARGARLVGIDSHNIDDTRVRTRPVHTALLGAGVLICEHMTNLAALPDSGFRFFAVPPKVAGMGTFPVRAFAEVAG